jgi:hypothetical protein
MTFGRGVLDDKAIAQKCFGILSNATSQQGG